MKHFSCVLTLCLLSSITVFAGTDLVCEIKETGGISNVRERVALNDNAYVKSTLRASTNPNIRMVARMGVLPNGQQNLDMRLGDDVSGWEVAGDAISQGTVRKGKKVSLKLFNRNTGEYFEAKCSEN